MVVGLAIETGEPRMLLSTFLAIEGEPYRTAAALPRETQAAAVKEIRDHQDRQAAEGLKAILGRLEGPVVAGLLVNRAGWITDLLSYSLEWDEHVPVAENLALREALRFGCRQNGAAFTELEEKSLPDLAAEKFGDLEARLKALGTAAGKPWRKEQKLACLAAWIAAV